MSAIRKFFASRYTKEEFSWILQDWANSVYSLMITTAIFPIFFKTATNAGVTAANSTAYLSYANSIATFVVAVMAPVLGALADYRGYRNPMFTISTMVGVFSVLGMMFAGSDQWMFLLILYTISAIGFSASNIFYDSSIMDVTTYERMDRISAAGFGYGYIGSVIPFILFMVIMQFSQLSGDIIVKITIETPKKLTDKQKELLQKFEESLNDKNYEQKSSFMKKVKKFFKDIIE